MVQLFATHLGLHPLVALKLWTTPRKHNSDPNELSALEQYEEERA